MLGRLFLGACGVVIAVSVSLQAAVPDPDQPPTGYTTALNAFNSGKETVIVPGNAAATKKNQDLLKTVARYLIYRAAKPPYNGETPRVEKKVFNPDDNTIVFLTNDLHRLAKLTNLTPVTPGHQQYANEFGKSLGDAGLEVLDDTTKPVEKLNTMILLVAAAERLPSETLADTFLTILKDPKYRDELRVYAFQGLRNLLKQESLTERPEDHQHIFNDRAKLVEVANALENTIVTYKPGTGGNDPAVIRFVRREAIRAAAQLRDPILRDKQKRITARPALTLLKAMRGDTLTPSTNEAEKLEALIGFCSQKADPGINTEVAAYWIAQTVLDLETAIKEDKAAAAKDATAKPRLHWKLQGARLADALEKLKKTLPNDKYINQVADAALADFAIKLQDSGMAANLNPRALTGLSKDKDTKKLAVPNLIREDATKAGS